MPDDSDQQLIAAIHDETLAAVDHPDAVATCEAIAARMSAEIDDAIGTLARAGIVVSRPEVDTRMQRHTARLDVPDAPTARRAAEALRGDGYEIWEPLDGAPGRIHTRFRNVVTVARTTDVTIAIRLRWPQRATRIPGPLLPNQADFATVSLPRPLWPLYFAIRPLRLAAERAGLRRPAPAVLGPFLSTPTDLIPLLLDLAEVTATDTVADLGCGDARILVEAAVRTGCRAIGVETDPGLVARANERASAAGVAGRVDIVCADAATADLQSATVVFVFLPADATVDLVDALLPSLTPGTRVIAHEQQRLPRSIPGATSTPLISGQGVTVAHRWIAGR